MKIFKFCCLIFLVLFISTCAFAYVCSGYKHSDSYDDNAVGKIPKEATQIDCVIPAPFDPIEVSEFNISETGFLQWVNEWKKIEPGISDPSTGPATIYAYDKSSKKISRIEFTNAIKSAWGEKDRGIYLVFDKLNSRAYFQLNTR